MLSRYYDTIGTSALDIFDPFKVFNEFDRSSVRRNLDSIDEEGIKIELPGVKSKDVDVTLDGRLLKISGKSRHGKEFSYAYNLKSSVDETKVSAKLEDGLLTVTLPKKQESSVKKILVT